MKYMFIVVAALALASCAGTFEILPDGSMVVDPAPIVIEPSGK